VKRPQAMRRRRLLVFCNIACCFVFTTYFLIRFFLHVVSLFIQFFMSGQFAFLFFEFSGFATALPRLCPGSAGEITGGFTQFF
jgi:hypothetical protein